MKEKKQNQNPHIKLSVDLYRRQFVVGGLLASGMLLLQACGGKGFSSPGTTPLGSQGGNDSLGTSPAPSPSAQPNPNPMPAPTPNPNPNPRPNPSPMPAPTPNPNPAPAPMPNPAPAPNPTPNPTPSPVPGNKVSLSDFGGVPNASSQTIISAFNQAFARLKSLGGGTLTIAPGVYNLGTHSNVSVISVSDLQNVLISGYGAQLVMTTGTTSTSATNNTPTFLHFQNPKNVTVAGLAFKDLGSDILFRNTGGRWGAICLNVYASVARSGFKTVDCVADDVVTFVRSDNRNAPYMFTGFDIHGTVRNSYYGVQMLRNGRYSKANITALNVRRAFLSQSCRDWEVNVTTNRTQGIGSNAHVVLDSFPDWPVQDCTINIKASGALNGYVCLGSICHQGPDGSYSVARNVKFNIQISNATSAATTGFISLTAEPENAQPYAGIRPSTKGAFENIQISGTVTGPYNGAVVANPSVSSATTNSVLVASNLAQFQNMNLLPKYFKVV